jgi:TetR/AcrR family transcriptional regulator
MRQLEKNLLSRTRIIESAKREFAAKGYGLSSINTICSEGGISKGNLYHYFKDKDTLYIACINDCFEKLSIFLKTCLSEDLSPQEELEHYFTARMRYFSQHMEDQWLFLEAVTAPPEMLKTDIWACRKPFDDLNTELLESILGKTHLKPGIGKEEAIETFRLFQDFVNARYPSVIDPVDREKICKRAIFIFLYGILNEEPNEKQ